jgi:hypothetical protein
LPGFLVNLTTIVTCTHQGIAKPTMTVPNVLVMGQPIVVWTSPYVVAGCTLPPPPVANGPCVKAAFLTGATRVSANGIPVLLQDSQALCAPSGTPLQIKPPPTRVTGI